MRGSDTNTSLRGWFAIAALLVFLITLGWGLSLAGTPRWRDAKEFLALVLPIEAGLLFAAGRYYFAQADPRPKNRTQARKR